MPATPFEDRDRFLSSERPVPPPLDSAFTLSTRTLWDTSPVRKRLKDAGTNGRQTRPGSWTSLFFSFQSPFASASLSCAVSSCTCRSKPARATAAVPVQLAPHTTLVRDARPLRRLKAQDGWASNPSWVADPSRLQLPILLRVVLLLLSRDPEGQLRQALSCSDPCSCPRSPTLAAAVPNGPTGVAVQPRALRLDQWWCPSRWWHSSSLLFFARSLRCPPPPVGTGAKPQPPSRKTCVGGSSAELSRLDLRLLQCASLVELSRSVPSALVSSLALLSLIHI